MRLTDQNIEGVFRIDYEPTYDDRGLFLRCYDKKLFEAWGLQTKWVQENQSISARRNTLRGLHFQRAPYAETKLFRVVRGAITDIAVDLRRDSPSYGRWNRLDLSEDEYSAIYVPKGCAHGFVCRTDNVLVLYKVDCAYHPEAESGLVWNDPDVAIDWGVDKPILSEKDRGLPRLGEVQPIDVGVPQISP